MPAAALIGRSGSRAVVTEWRRQIVVCVVLETG